MTRFKNWAATRAQDFGEWECDYEDWAALCTAAEDALANTGMPESEIELLLYALARDNEVETIKSMLERYVDNGMRIARAAVEYSDRDARWQAADFPGSQTCDEARMLLRRFASDEDEYVRRRALLASVRQEPEFAETTAWEWVASEHEYSRLVALTILRELRSPRLRSAVERLRADPSWVVQAEIASIESAG